MNAVFLTAAVLGVLGLACGVALAVVAKRFAVPGNPVAEAVLRVLPGANCGGCGHPGCDGYARAVADGSAPLNLCTSCDATMLAALERITGRSGGDVMERRVALVRCGGDRDAATRRFDYNGIEDCAAAQATAGGDKACSYGCLGYGSCVRVCPVGAIAVENGVARVDPTRCIGCGACVRTCPRGVIALVPADRPVHVLCASRDKGPAVRSYCRKGCLGCGLCARLDKSGAFSVQDNLAAVSGAFSGDASAIAQKCPGKCISIRNAKRDTTT